MAGNQNARRAARIYFQGCKYSGANCHSSTSTICSAYLHWCLLYLICFVPLWLINSHFRSHLSIFAGTRVLRYGFDEALIYDVAAYVSAQVAAAETSASAGAAAGSRTSPSTATTRRSRAGAKAAAWLYTFPTSKATRMSPAHFLISLLRRGLGASGYT